MVCVALACGEDSSASGTEAGVEVVRSFADGQDPEDGAAVAGTWRFADGSTIAGVRLSPTSIRGSGPLTVTFTAHGLCGGRVGALPPRAAARQDVYRGRPLAHADDPRARWVTVEGGDGERVVELGLSRPYHPRRVDVVFEQDCDGTLVPAVEGARAEALRDGEPLEGGRAVLGSVEVAREPTRVRAARGEVTVDGALDEAVWAEPGIALVTSLDGEPSEDPSEDPGTEVWFAWDDSALFVAARIEDPDVWSEYAEHDDPLYRQEAFEVFVAGERAEDGYLEFQVSARNVTFDAHFRAYRKGDEAWDSAWTTAVNVRGTVNERGDPDDPDERDEGWTVEAAIPWSEICDRTGATCPPRPGTRLRVNAFRLEKADRKRQAGYALSPTLAPDFHAWKNAATLGLEG